MSKKATVFTKDELIKAAAVFGVQPEQMAGALFNTEAATKAQAEKLLKTFLTKGVR